MTLDELAERIYGLSSIKGEFRLRSGQISNIYFDKYLFEGQPELLLPIARGMADLIPVGTEILAGLEMGGIPVVTMLSQVSGIPAVFVRKKAKEHGTCKLVEGGTVAGKKVVVVEDVVTSGGQILESAAELARIGAIIADVLCVIDRESGGQSNLAAKGLSLRPLFRMSALKKAASTVTHGTQYARPIGTNVDSSEK